MDQMMVVPSRECIWAFDQARYFMEASFFRCAMARNAQKCQIAVTRRMILVVVPENRARPILGLTRFMHAAVCSDSARARASRDVIGWSARYSCPFSLKGV